MATTKKFVKRKAKSGFRIEFECTSDASTVPSKPYVSSDVEDEAIIEQHKEKIIIKKDMLIDIRKLGSGRFGHVMLTEIKGHPEIRVAVKRLNLVPSMNESEDYTARTDLRTIRTVGTGINPHVTKFYAALVDQAEPPQLIICMEACETSMEKFYAAMYKINETKYLDLLLKRLVNHIVDALHFLKSKNILHRDVKPSNILINQNPVIFKLCDFGICGEMTNSVNTTMTKGTRIYLAPERLDQTISPAGYGIRSDMWALGLSVLEIATNRHPFIGMEETAILGKLHAWTPDLPSSLSTELQQLIVWLLNVEQAKRPLKYDEILSSSAMQSLPPEITDEETQMVKNVMEHVPLVPDE